MTQYVKKIVMLGNPAVGKTSLVKKFVQDMFDDKYLKTLGAKPSKKVVNIGDDEITLMLWDIAGHAYYLHQQFYSGAKGAILVCDLTRKETLDALQTWHTTLTAKVGDVPTIVLGNKSDLFDAEFGKEDIDALGFENTLTSAKTGDNVDSSFLQMAEMTTDG